MKTNEPMKKRYDVVVVGARCAGAATAMLLARRGRSVLCIDRAQAGTDTLSTHALMRGGVERLVAWGLGDRLASLGAPPIRTTTFAYAGRATEVAIRARDGVEALYAPRRHALDAMLIDAARESGADVRHGVRFEGVLRDSEGRPRGARLVGRRGETVEIEASLVVGADGRRSRVAREVGAPVRVLGGHGAAFAYAYFEGLELEGYHWVYERGAAAGLIPTSDGRVNIFVAHPPGRDPGFFEALAGAAPDYVERVRRARQVGRVHRFEGAPGHLREAAGPGWALVGDAGAYRDPITAHGMTDALSDAELLAEAIARPGAGDLEGYERRRDARSIEILALSDRIASFDWSLDELQRIHRRLAEAMQRCRIVRHDEPSSPSARTATKKEERPWIPT